MRCRPGDLAVVIDAANKSNIGRIVTVVRRYDGPFVLHTGGPAWLVRSATRMTWTGESKRYRWKAGPALDAQLQPIRGNPGKQARSIVISTSMCSPNVRIALTNPLTLVE